jgi:hypothetical protein
MRKYAFASVLWVSIIGGSLAVATPARATLWRNFGSTNAMPLY